MIVVLALGGDRADFPVTRSALQSYQERRRMRFVVTITQDEDGMYVAECPSVPGCVSQGKRVKEAEVNIKEAIRECLTREDTSRRSPYPTIERLPVARSGA